MADSPPTAWTEKRQAGKLLTPFFRRIRSKKFCHLAMGSLQVESCNTEARLNRRSAALPPLMEMVHRTNALADFQRVRVLQGLLQPGFGFGDCIRPVIVAWTQCR